MDTYKSLKSRIRRLEPELLSDDSQVPLGDKTLIDPDVYKALQGDVLDYMLGLPNSRLVADACQTVKRLNFSPLEPAGAGSGQRIINRYYQNLCELERQLERVKRLRSQHRRPKHRRKADFCLPPKDADSKGRARTVALIIKRLRPFRATSDGQDYQRLQEQDPSFVLALEKVWTRPKLQGDLTEAKSDRAKKQIAMRFAADYYEKEVSTVQTDWKDHKPSNYRRKH